MTRVVQIRKNESSSAALVDEPRLVLLAGARSVYELAHIAEASGQALAKIGHDRARGERLDYGAVYTGQSDWKLLPPINHPVDPARCLVSGTGLTHLGSAKNRQAMHSASQAELNDSMKIFR